MGARDRDGSLNTDQGGKPLMKNNVVGQEEKNLAAKILAAGVIYFTLISGLTFLFVYFGGIRGYWTNLGTKWVIPGAFSFISMIGLMLGNIILLSKEKIGIAHLIQEWIMWLAILFAMIFAYLSAGFIYPSLQAFNSITVSLILAILSAIVLCFGTWLGTIFLFSVAEEKASSDEYGIIAFVWIIFFSLALLIAVWAGTGLANKKNFLHDQSLFQLEITAVVKDDIIEVSFPSGAERDYFYRTVKLVGKDGKPHWFLDVKGARAGGLSQRDKIYIPVSSAPTPNQLDFIVLSGEKLAVPVLGQP